MRLTLRLTSALVFTGAFLSSLQFCPTAHAVNRRVFRRKAPDRPLESPEVRERLKENYTLFNPVPLDLMRELSPDRPGIGDNPYTVDAGHFQLELEFFNSSRLTQNSTTQTSYNAPSFNFKAGVTRSSDFQIVFFPYLRNTTKSPGQSPVTNQGVGDLTLRYKFNLQGNDGGAVSAAILPSIKLPTSSGGVGNNRVEYTLALPLAIEHPQGFSLGMMPKVSLNKNQENQNSHLELGYSLVVSHALVGEVDGYIEYGSTITNELTPVWKSEVQIGLLTKVGEDVQLDLACNFGLNQATPQINPFAGAVFRY